MKKIAIVLVAAIAVFGIYEGFNDNEMAPGGKMTVTYSGVDLSCGSCTTQMKTSLNKIIGIKDFDMKASKDLVKVTFNSKIMQAEWITKSLEAAGFSPDSVETVAR